MPDSCLRPGDSAAALAAESVRPKIDVISDTQLIKRRCSRWIMGAGGLCLLAAIAGCAPSEAARPPAAAPKSHSTPVPRVLVGYSSAAAGALGMTVAEATQLESEMKHQSPSSLTNTCSDEGGSIANEYSAFESLYLPPQAHSVFRDATTGYKTILSSTDECGMAADGNSKSQMKVAVNDLRYGLWLLTRAQTGIQAWSHSTG